jgi:hypothetical protein
MEKIIGFYEKVKTAESEGAAFAEKAQNMLDAIADKKQAQRDKELADIQKRIDLKNQEELNNAIADEKEEIRRRDWAVWIKQQEEQKQKDIKDAETKKFEAIAENQRQLDVYNKNIELDNKDLANSKLAAKQKSELDKLVFQNKLAGASLVLGQVKGILDEESAAYKTIAIPTCGSCSCE